MDERDIQIFQSLMETRNVTKTAQALYMTQSAITKRLHKLEEELGAPLFLRSVKGLIPAPSADAIGEEMAHGYEGEVIVCCFSEKDAEVYRKLLSC